MPNRSFPGLHEYMDEIVHRNLGPEGKETVLIKHLKGKSIQDYYEACDLTPYPEPGERKSGVSAKVECIIRPMKPSEAIEVSKCIYRAYGYSYGYEHLYYPERLLELNQSGRMHSAVATTEDGKIIGHCALIHWHHHPRIAEMAQGVVTPAYRSRGCFVKLTRYLIDKAYSEGLMGIFDQPVTIHTYSQDVSHGFGLKDCALILGYIPSSVRFKGIVERLSERSSVLIHFMYLDKPTQLAIYPPPHHRDMILRLYENLGVRPEIKTPEDSAARNLPSRSMVEIKTVSSLNLALIEVLRYGRDILSEIKGRLKELCLKRIEVINLYSDMRSPVSSLLVEDLEKMGFFFAGILPGAASGGDAFILQYLNNIPIDYGNIKIASEMGRELVSYIMRHDPNRT